MNLEDNRTPLKCNKTERRTGQATEAQRFASVENFTLFILNGIKKNIRNERIKEIISPAVADTIYLCADQEVRRIKSEQEARKGRR